MKKYLYPIMLPVVFMITTLAIVFAIGSCKDITLPSFANFNFQTGTDIPAIKVDSNGVCVSGSVIANTNAQSFVDSLKNGISFTNQNFNINLKMDSIGHFKIGYSACVPFKK